MLPFPAQASVGRSVYTPAPTVAGFSINYSPPPPPLLPLLSPSPSPPLLSPQRISGRTCSKAGTVLSMPAVEYSSSTEEPRPPPPEEVDQALSHTVGLVSMLDKTPLLAIVIKNSAVDSGRRKKPSFVGSHGQPLIPTGGHEGTPSPGGCGEIPCVLASRTATQDGIGTTLDDQRLPYKRPEFPRSYASDLRVSGSYNEAMRLEYAHLWKGSTEREVHGLSDASRSSLYGNQSTTSSPKCGSLTGRPMSTVGAL